MRRHYFALIEPQAPFSLNLHGLRDTLCQNNWTLYCRVFKDRSWFSLNWGLRFKILYSVVLQQESVYL